MTKRNVDWVRGMGVGATVLGLSILVMTAGLQWTSTPAYATERAEERRDDRGDRRDDRRDVRLAERPRLELAFSTKS